MAKEKQTGIQIRKITDCSQAEAIEFFALLAWIKDHWAMEAEAIALAPNMPLVGPRPDPPLMPNQYVKC